MSLTSELIQDSVFTDTDRSLLSRALELAAKGVGQVSPGPAVGCVITDVNARIVGEGYYLFEELNHAETVALRQAGDLARGGTAYVSLEPHAHHGRTPPCTEALIAAGIKRVVAPIEDLNPKVSGRGFEHLRAAGITVDAGLLKVEAERLNEKYLHFMRTGRPFVHLKLAVSLDGKIATKTGQSKWITGAESLRRVQEFRHESDAVLVGAGTVMVDDPSLTDRSNLKRRRPLVRVVLDDRLELTVHSRLLRTASENPVIVFTSEKVAVEKIQMLRDAGAEVITSSSSRDLRPVLEHLAQRSLQSVLVEGGAKVAGKFFDAGLVDKASFFIAPKIIGGERGVSAVGGSGVANMSEAWSLQNLSLTQRGEDVELTGYPHRESST